MRRGDLVAGHQPAFFGKRSTLGTGGCCLNRRRGKGNGDDLTIERGVDHVLFMHQGLRQAGIEASVQDNVLHQDTVGLADTMAPVLCLRDVTRHPV